jgi:hypothetical protein
MNQIRAWVREGRTDAWIAHQLDVSTSELREFRRQHDLAPGEDDTGSLDADLRDEIEAEIEAAAAEEEALADSVEEVEVEEEAETVDEEETETDGEEAEGRPRRRRRRRRGRGRGGSNELEGTFDHGEEGYGLWLDPAVQDIPAYRDNWAGNREVKVTVEEDRIVIRRVESD